jgi:DNA-binding SARP family transcriptional activator/tetratricopeptide (TPR) repeat protein
MRFGILGPLSVTDGAREIAVTAGRDRVVLATLLLRPGRIVAVDELIDALWADDPPATARGQLQTCVSRLRRTLPQGTILTDPAGYGISPDPDDLDAAVFARLIDAARGITDPDAGRLLFRRALDLWRGNALAGIDSAAVRPAAGALDEQRMIATEDWAERELAAGRHRELLGELSGLVDRFPLRERLRGALMLALARSGRQADALAEYRRGWAVLRAELGIEPGRDLRDLHQRILAGAEPGSGSGPAGAPARIRCLPRTIADFTGRADTVRRLVKTIEQGEPAGPVVAVVDGMAGSGKTTLALHVASLVGAAYPDAHLFIDLHGHSERAPIEPAAGLLALLRQLAIPPEQIPAEREERVALWRSELAGRRVLVIFDNAASSGQVADLLPTSAGSLALITSRRRLAGLDGVHPESLAVLADDEAVALLARIAGDRVGADPDAAAEVVRRCGRLPLAIRLAGARLAHRPRWQVTDLVRRLGESALPELAAEDRTVASAFALSYGQLAERTQRMFRLLGVYPGPAFDALGAAAVADLPLDDAEDLLDDLVDVHLIEEPEPGVYRLHDLLREYASALAADVPAADRQAAVRAVLDFQLHAIAASVPAGQRRVADRDLRLAAPLRPDLVAAVADPAARVERERPSLDVLAEAGVAAGRREYAWQLPRAAWRHLWSRGYHQDIAHLQSRALAAARAAGDRSAEAMSANYLGSAYFRQARYDEARRLVEHSVRIRRELGENTALSTSLGNLSAIHEASGRYVEAAETAAAALHVPRRGDDSYETSLLLNNVAVALGTLGRYAEALRAQRLRLMQLFEMRDDVGIANSLLHIVVMKRRAGTVHAGVAERGIRAALRLFRRAEYVFGEADARNELAELLRSEGRFAESMAQHRLALDQVRKLGDRRFEADFLNEMGRTVRAAGDLDQARDLHLAALRIARAIPQPYEQARAYLGLGDCLARSAPDEARRYWRQAGELFDRMRLPERFEAAERLAAVDGGVDLLRVAAGGETMGS